MSEEPNAKIRKITPLATRLPRKSGVNPNDVVAQAQEGILALARSKTDLLQRNIAGIRRAWENYDRNPDPEMLDRLFQLIHNLRGLGATFGYPLITDVGESFGRYMIERPAGAKVKPEIIKQHVDALCSVFGQEMKGDGNATAQAVIGLLRDMVAKELGGT